MELVISAAHQGSVLFCVPPRGTIDGGLTVHDILSRGQPGVRSFWAILRKAIG